MKATEIAIVGFGTAGGLAAYLLARQGHRVTVLEQSPELGPVGAGILLQPSGQLVLERVGLLEAVIARAEPIERLHALTHGGKTLIDLPYGELGGGCKAYGVHRGELFTAIQQAVATTDAKVVLGVQATSAVEEGDKVVVRSASGETLGIFDAVLACDGTRSELRQKQPPAGTRAMEYPHGALWTVGRCEKVRRKLLQVTHGTRLMCGLLPMGEGRCSLFWSLRKDEKEALFARRFAAWREQVLQLCPDAAEMFADWHGFEDVRFVTYMHVTMRRPVAGRLAFLGDAAHAMSPHLGQGANLALLDAYALAEEFARVASIEDAFAGYAARRSMHTRVYSAVTRMLSPFFQSRGVIKGWGRDVFLPLMTKTPGLRGQMILTMSGLRRGWLGGRLELGAAQAVNRATAEAYSG